MSELAYRRELPAVLERLRHFYECRPQERVLAVMNVPSPAVAEFAGRYLAGRCEYPEPEERVAFWDAHLHSRAGILDDGIPAAYLTECDQGLYGGSVGGDVRYMADPGNGWISSMVPPILDDLSQVAGLRVDTDSRAWRRFLRQLEVFRAGAAGKWGLSHFILIDGLNFVFELVGATNAYLALLDAPDLVRQAMEFAFDLNVRVQETFFGAGTLLSGGTCSNMVQWIPGRVVSESIDPWHMTSLREFEAWGRAPVERILGHFDGGVTHIHGNGRHLLEAACTLRGLKAVYLADDRGFPRAFDILPELRRRAGDMPLCVGCAFVEFVDALRAGRLTGGVLYHVSGAPDVDTANRVMDEVREYRV